MLGFGFSYSRNTGARGYVPSWVPKDATGRPAALVADFAGDRYFHRGRTQSSRAAFSAAGSRTFSRSTSKQRINSAGSYEAVDVNLEALEWSPALTALGLSLEGARTNSARSGACAGAALGLIGSGGSLPTNMAVSINPLPGISVDVQDFGAYRGLVKVKLRFFGTPTSSGSSAIVFSGDNGLISAAAGQTWTWSTFLRLAGGSLDGLGSNGLYLSINERQGSTAVANSSSGPIALPGGELIEQRYEVSRTLTEALTDRVSGEVRFHGNSGVPLDFTIEFAVPQVEAGPFASSVMLSSGAALTRAADTETYGPVAVYDAGDVNQFSRAAVIASTAGADGSAVEGPSGTWTLIGNTGSNSRGAIDFPVYGAVGKVATVSWDTAGTSSYFTIVGEVLGSGSALTTATTGNRRSVSFRLTASTMWVRIRRDDVAAAIVGNFAVRISTDLCDHASATLIPSGGSTITQGPTGTYITNGDGTNTATARIPFPTVVGRAYRVEIPMVERAVFAGVGSAAGDVSYGSGTLTTGAVGVFVFVATTTTSWIDMRRSSLGQATVANVIAREALPFEGFTQGKGAIIFEGDTRWSTLAYTTLIDAFTNDGTNRIALEISTAGQMRARWINGGGGAAEIYATPPASGARFRAMLLWQTDRFEFWLDGTLIGSDASGTPPAIAQINVGRNYVGSSPLFGHESLFSYFSDPPWDRAAQLSTIGGV